MNKHFVNDKRRPLGIKVNYQQQKDLLRNKKYFEQMQEIEQKALGRVHPVQRDSVT